MKTLLLAIILTRTVDAGLVLTLDESLQSGPPGATLSYTGLLENTNTTGSLFLNGVSFTLSSGDLVLDFSPFALQAPLSLDPLAAYAGTLFDVIILSSALPATYNGTFSVLGGADEFAAEELTNTPFQVSVVETPEPSSAKLTLLMLAFWTMAGRRLVRERTSKDSSGRRRSKTRKSVSSNSSLTNGEHGSQGT